MVENTLGVNRAAIHREFLANYGNVCETFKLGNLSIITNTKESLNIL